METVDPQGVSARPDLRTQIGDIIRLEKARLGREEDRVRFEAGLVPLRGLTTDSGQKLKALAQSPHQYSEGLSLLCSLATLARDDEGSLRAGAQAEALFAELGARLYPDLPVNESSVTTLRSQIQASRVPNGERLVQSLNTIGDAPSVELALGQISGVMEGIIYAEHRGEFLDEAAERQLEVLVRTACVLLRLRNRLREPVNPSSPDSLAEQIPAQAVETVRDDVREQVLLQEVMRQGASALHTSVPAEYSSKKSSGFQTQNSEKRLAKGQVFSWDASAKLAQTMGEHRLEDGFRKHGLNEGLTLLPITEEIVEERVTAGGLFRRETKERKVVGSKPVLHSELVLGGASEPAVRFIYAAEDGNQRAYQDYSGRYGQVLSFEVILPKSTGDKLMAAVRKNPALARRVVGALVLQDLKIDQKLWETGEGAAGHPLKPPYAQWASTVGTSSIYVAPQDGKADGFDPRCVVQLKTQA